jgi:hypothetical protein
MRIWRGPFRGAHIVLNPRHSLRKVFGFYEHELNAWLSTGIRRVSRVLDVGANDGYFTFGCAAAFRRLRVDGEIIGFEPQARLAEEMRKSTALQGQPSVRLQIVQSFVGREVGEHTTTLDALPFDDRYNTLIKVDVEGAELDVLAGARSWMNSSNLFLIEVHRSDYLAQLREMFAERGLKLVQVNQHGLPFVGREERAQSNWWLVSDVLGRS